MEGRYVFQSPTRVRFGAGVAAEVGKEALLMGMRRVFLVTDQGLLDAPFYGEIEQSLKAAGLTVSAYGQVLPDPTAQSINQAIQAYRASGADSLVALGGGSPMDTAKAVGVLAAGGDDDIVAYTFGGPKTPAGIPPLICLPTTAGTGSEVTFIAIVTYNGSKRLVRHPSIAPALALVDPSLSLSMPQSLTASTGLDALAHALEALTSTQSNAVTDELALEAIARIGAWLPKAVEDGSDLEARTHMSKAATDAGLAFLNARVHLGHAVGHSLGTAFKIPHGFACAMCLPAILSFIRPAAREALDKAAAALGHHDAAKAVQELMERVGAPNLSQALGAISADIPALIEMVEATEQRLIGLSRLRPEPEDWQQIFEASL